MAHIISFMDEALSSGLHGFAMEAELGSSSRRKTVAPRPKKTGSAVAAAKDVPVDYAEVRMDRVRALRAAIADGSYKVSASDLADSILRSMLSNG